MPPTVPYPGHTYLAETLSGTLTRFAANLGAFDAPTLPGDAYSAEAGHPAGTNVDAESVLVNLLSDPAHDHEHEPLHIEDDVHIRVGRAVTDYGQTGWDGSASFDVTMWAGERGQLNVRSFRLRVEEIDPGDVRRLPGL